jgi:hypothetical protein
MTKEKLSRINCPPPIARDRHPKPVSEGSTMHWRIYYADGRITDSTQIKWADAPVDGICAIVHAINDEPADCELGTPYYWNHGDWIARVWDVTLYLRQTGKVKFGRWASHGLFNEAWTSALESISDTPEEKARCKDVRSLQSGCVFTTKVVEDAQIGQTWSLYYDDRSLVTSEVATWEQAPADGVLAGTYTSVYSGMQLRAAMRRYTYWFWRGHELINTDDLDLVLTHFPQCKHGQPAFAGRSYRHQAEAISQAIKDQLKDIR